MQRYAANAPGAAGAAAQPPAVKSRGTQRAMSAAADRSAPRRPRCWPGARRGSAGVTTCGPQATRRASSGQGQAARPAVDEERRVSRPRARARAAPRRAAARTFRPSLSSRRPSSPRWHTTLGSDSLGDPALDIRPAQRTKAASRRLHGVTRRTWGPRRRFCAADTRAPTGPGRRRLFELRVVVRRTNAQLMVPRTDSRRSNTAFVFTGGGHARTRNERGGVQRMRSSERSAWRPALPRRCSLVIEFKAHPIMDFVVFQRDVVLVDSVPEAGVANHALG